MKNPYEAPKVEIVVLDSQDVIVASGAVDEDEDDW